MSLTSLYLSKGNEIANCNNWSTYSICRNSTWSSMCIFPAMPYLLSFAAGAMIYVVVEELIPEMSVGEHSNVGVLTFDVGFSLMMALDVALG